MLLFIYCFNSRIYELQEDYDFCYGDYCYDEDKRITPENFVSKVNRSCQTGCSIQVTSDMDNDLPLSLIQNVTISFEVLSNQPRSLFAFGPISDGVTITLTHLNLNPILITYNNQTTLKIYDCTLSSQKVFQTDFSGNTLLYIDASTYSSFISENKIIFKNVFNLEDSISDIILSPTKYSFKYEDTSGGGHQIDIKKNETDPYLIQYISTTNNTLYIKESNPQEFFFSVNKITIVNDITITVDITNSTRGVILEFLQSSQECTIKSPVALQANISIIGDITLTLDGLSSIIALLLYSDSNSTINLILQQNQPFTADILVNSGNPTIWASYLDSDAEIIAQKFEIASMNSAKVLSPLTIKNLLILNKQTSLEGKTLSILAYDDPKSNKNNPKRSKIAYFFGSKNGICDNDYESSSEEIVDYFSKINVTNLFFENASLQFDFQRCWKNDYIPDLANYINKPIEFVRASVIECENLTAEYWSLNSFFSTYTEMGSINKELVMKSECKKCTDDQNFHCIYGMLVKQPKYVYRNETYKLTRGNLCAIIIPYVMVIIGVVIFFILRAKFAKKKIA